MEGTGGCDSSPRGHAASKLSRSGSGPAAAIGLCGTDPPVRGAAVNGPRGAHDGPPGQPSGARGAGQVGGPYRPSADEEFMGECQKRYFRDKLLAWRDSIRAEADVTRAELQRQPLRQADSTDRASSESDWSLELRTRDRQRKLIAKIDAALRRLDEGEYGYCVVTGEPISLARLDARPIATMTVEAQETHERNERISRDD